MRPDKETRTFITKVRTLMMEKGIPLDRGSRQIATVKAVDVHNVPESTYSSGEQDEQSPPRVHTARLLSRTSGLLGGEAI